MVKASETVHETIDYLPSIMDESDTIVYNALYCKASAIARKNNILIATRHLHTTANADTKKYYYRIYRNFVGSVVKQLQQCFRPMFPCFAKATHLILLYLGKFTLSNMLAAFFILCCFLYLH